MQKQGYNTKQKALVLQCLFERKNEHLSVEEIVAHLANRQCAVGRTTIYRVLEQLVQSAQVQRYQFESGAGACYQYLSNGAVCSEHFHCKCVRCGELLHLDCTFLTSLYDHLSSEHHFIIDQGKTVFYGLCDTCREKEENL